MESLSEEVWDVVIAGTGLPHSLLALALSRSDKKVLHVDVDAYYGGEDAGFSLQDAVEWVKKLKKGKSLLFTDASVETFDVADSALTSPRSYTLSLNPQIVYAQSRFLPTLVSSQIHSQLEFLAVGSWWVHRDGVLQKIPSTREDVFSDESLSMRDKRSLMKFLRYVLQEDEESVEGTAHEQTLAVALKSKFRVPATLEAPILALALCPGNANTITLNEAAARIRRHMRSVGYFGPGFGAVIAKYGGNAEISQVACRAQAVGGGVYLLGHGIEEISPPRDVDSTDRLIEVKLSDGTSVRSRWVVGGIDDLPASTHPEPKVRATTTIHTIDIISDPLPHLFSATSENGPVPAAAIILVQDELSTDSPPIYLQVHSEDTGECPTGHSVIYGSLQSADSDAKDRLHAAVSKVISNGADAAQPRSLWHLSYVSHRPRTYETVDPQGMRKGPRVAALPVRPHDIALQDETLIDVETLWTAIMGGDADAQNFLRFEEREQQQQEAGE